MSDRLLLTVEEAGAALGVGRSLMYELIAGGQIETVRVGRLRRIRPEALRRYVEHLADEFVQTAGHISGPAGVAEAPRATP